MRNTHHYSMTLGFFWLLLVENKLNEFDPEVLEKVRRTLLTAADEDSVWFTVYTVATANPDKFYCLVARAFDLPLPAGKIDTRYAINNLPYLFRAMAEKDEWAYRLYVPYSTPYTVTAVTHSPEKIYRHRHSNHHRR